MVWHYLLLFSGHIRQHQRLPCDNAVFIGRMVDRKDIVRMTDIAIKLKTDPIERLPVPDRVRAAGLQVCDRIVLSAVELPPGFGRGRAVPPAPAKCTGLSSPPFFRPLRSAHRKPVHSVCLLWQCPLYLHPPRSPGPFMRLSSVFRCCSVCIHIRAGLAALKRRHTAAELFHRDRLFPVRSAPAHHPGGRIPAHSISRIFW